VSSALPYLRDYVINLSAFEQQSMIGESDAISKEIYDRVEDQFLIFVKSIALSEHIEESQMVSEIEKLINLRHPCIAGPIGFVVRIESGSPQELKIVRFYLEGCSLAEVLPACPVWWTSTVKAKVVAGIVLGLEFAHSLGLVHNRLTANNILFDSDHCLQIVDFNAIQLEVGENKGEDEERPTSGGFSEQRWTPKADIYAFASILFEIVVGRQAHGETSVPANIPDFVSQIIHAGLWSGSQCSFHDILEILKKNDFQIEDGVDSAEVFAFISWVESAEQSER
jgi:serine/threonine protein kinase